MTEQPPSPDPQADENAPKLDSIEISFERVLELLEKGKFDNEHGAIRWSSNYTFLTSLTHDDLTLMSVYKPRSGERPLWDFPDGTLCQRERAAFLVSETLDWQLVPPTVLREGPRGVGSVQFYIDHDPQFNYFSFDESFVPQLSRLALFDVLINNADRKGGHCIVDAENHLWGIDHGIAFHSSHKLRTVIWNFAESAIPQPLLDDIRDLCEQLENTDSDFHQQICDLLSPVEINAFRRRIERVLKTGEYPGPGPGPNYPWPPV